MAIKYINIFQYKALQNLPQIGLFGLKINHLATMELSSAQLAWLGAIFSVGSNFSVG
jgi:hypothetical protein